MQNNTIVKGDYLIELTNELKKKSKKIENIKNDQLLPTLKQYGLITTNDINQVEKITNIKNHITEIEKDLKNLTVRLENTIIPGYQETSQSIKKAFNVDFHNEMENLIDIIKTE